MNEDDRGITPANVTAMTVEMDGAGWLVTVERGNGESVQTLNLTNHERMMLACLLEASPGQGEKSVEFVDLSRHRDVQVHVRPGQSWEMPRGIVDTAQGPPNRARVVYAGDPPMPGGGSGGTGP